MSDDQWMELKGALILIIGMLGLTLGMVIMK